MYPSKETAHWKPPPWNGECSELLSQVIKISADFFKSAIGFLLDQAKNDNKDLLEIERNDSRPQLTLRGPCHYLINVSFFPDSIHFYLFVNNVGFLKAFE